MTAPEEPKTPVPPDRDVLPGALRRVVGGVAALSVVAVAWHLSRRPLTDYDLPWNIATGRIVVATRAIPRIDELAFTHGPLRYVEVLGDVFFYAVDRGFHARGLQFVGALAAAGAVVVTFLRMRHAGLVAYLLAAWFVAATAQWFTVRPATLSLLLLPVGLSFLDVHRATGNVRRLLPLVPLAFVWANIHGMVAVFAALLVAYASCFAVEARGEIGRRDAVGTTLVVLVALAAASLNTYGPWLLLGPFRGDEVLAGITEWARPSLRYFVTDVPVAATLFAFSLVVIALGREPDGRRKPPLFDVVLCALAVFGFFSVVRLTPLSLLLVVPLAARRAASCVPETPLVGIAAATASAASAFYVALFVPVTDVPGFDPARFPVAAIDFVQRVHPDGQMYDFMPFGGYLSYRLYPSYRVFMDGRNTLARSAAFVTAARRAGREPSAFASAVRDDRLEWAITSSAEGEVHDLPLARSPEWQMIYLDDVAAVYVRRGGPNAKLARHGYRALRHIVEPGGLLRETLHDGPVAVALGHDGALALAQAPSSPRACFLAAAGGIAAKDFGLFTEGVERLARLEPAHPALPLLRNTWSARVEEPGPAAEPRSVP